MAQQNQSIYSDKISDEFIKNIENGATPWQKEWKPNEFQPMPFNEKTGKIYRGINLLRLDAKGYNDPRWFTIKQANELGYKVKKGSKAVKIKYFQDSELNKETGEYEKLDKPVYRSYNIFNGTQLDGIEPYKQGEIGFDPIEKAESLIAQSPVNIIHDQRDRAFYDSRSDEIHMPDKSTYQDAYGYYATALHEIGHSTGHESRLNREFGKTRGTKEYAREELRAEIASYMMAREIGISHDPSRHAGYVESWLEKLKDDPKEIYRASRDAEIMAQYVMQPEKRLELEQRYGVEKDVAEKVQDALKEAVGKGETNTVSVNDNIDVVFVSDKPKKQDKTQSQEKGNAMDNEFNNSLNGTWYELTYEENAGRLITSLKEPAIINGKECNVAFIDPDIDDKFSFNKLSPVEFRDMTYKEIYNPDRGDYDIYVANELSDEYASKLELSSKLQIQLSSEQSKTIDKQSAKDAPRHYIDVPKEEKDEAKGLGAKWDGKAKSWYINPDEHDRDKFRWADKDVTELQQAQSQEKPKGKQPSQVSKDIGYVQKDVLSKEEEFSRFLADRDIIVEKPIFDGKVHRAREVNDKGKAMSASYIAFDDGAISGVATNFRTGEQETWVYSQQSRETTQTNDQRKEYRLKQQQSQAEREAKREKGAKTAYAMYSNAEKWADQSNSPYLANKRVKGHGLKLITGHSKVPDGTALLPVRDNNGRIVGGQLLLPEKNDRGTDKMFIGGTAKHGNYHTIDKAKSIEKAGKPLVIAEGYATGASVHEATKLPVVVAFDADNLAPVAENLRQKYPDKQIIIASDNDVSKDKNIGLEKAEKASVKVNGIVISPSFNDDEKSLGLSDFNDLANSRGHDAIKEAFKDHITQPKQKSKQSDLEIA